MSNYTAGVMVCLYVAATAIIICMHIKNAKNEILSKLDKIEKKMDRFYTVVGNLEDETDQILAWIREE